MATIKDVANRAGVSISTVSSVLNNTKSVSEPLRRSVLAAVDELGYRADASARNMKRKSTGVIGVIFTSFNTIFMSQVMNGIQTIAAENEYQLLFYCTDFDIDKEKQYVDMLLGNRVDGFLIDTAADRGDKPYFEYLSNLCVGEKRVWVVSLEQDLSGYGIPSVYANNFLGGKLATTYLLSQGCRDIVVLTGPEHLELIHDRVEGYKASLREAGIPLDAYRIVNGDYSTTSGYLAVKRLILDGVDFDGIFSCNDQMALGVLKALRESNLPVPDRVKVIGFDNTFVSSLVQPSLTTVNIPKYRMGAEAAKLLVGQIRGDCGSLGLNRELPINLITRMTTNPEICYEIELEW